MAKVFSNPRPAIALATRTILAAGALVLITQACQTKHAERRLPKNQNLPSNATPDRGPHFSRCIRS